MLRRIGVALLACGLSGTPTAQPADQVRLLASNCANCHGTDGHSQGGLPALAGLARPYLIQQLQDFKSGRRPATIMQQLSKGYTDAEIDALAGYFSSLKN